jgi:hypothetical protein
MEAQRLVEQRMTLQRQYRQRNCYSMISHVNPQPGNLRAGTLPCEVRKAPNRLNRSGRCSSVDVIETYHNVSKKIRSSI